MNIACNNANITIKGSCKANMNNIMNCIMETESILDDDIKVISVLGSEYNKELLMRHNHAMKDVIMFDYIIEDSIGVNNEIDGYYSISQLNSYKCSLKLFSKYNIRFYEYYGMLSERVIETVLNVSDDINTNTFYTYLSLAILEEEYGFQFSKEHLISDSLSLIKVLGNGKYEEKSMNLYNVYQEEYGYYYISNNGNNDIYLYCDWSEENKMGKIKTKYIILLNNPYDELQMFLNSVINKLGLINEMNYKLVVFSYDIEYDIGSNEYNETIQYLLDKYNPLFIGGKSYEERITMNNLLSDYDNYLFSIFPYNNEECLNKVYHLSIPSFKKIYDTLYYFLEKGVKKFYLILEKSDISDEIYMKTQINKLNESYNRFDINFHIIYMSDDVMNVNIEVVDNCVIYISLNYNNTKEILRKLNEKCINNRNCDIVVMNDYPSLFWNNEENDSNYYFIDSMFSFIDDLKYYNNYCLKLLESIECDRVNREIFLSGYLSVLLYGKALLSESFYHDRLIGEILHDISIPLEVSSRTYFSKYNELMFPTRLFKRNPYNEYLLNSYIHFISLVDYNSKICDCRKMYVLCYDKKIVNIGLLCDSMNYAIESRLLLTTFNLILDNYITKNDNLNKAYYRPMYFDIQNPEEIDEIMIIIESHNMNHIFGGINESYVDRILHCSCNKNNTIQIWYTNHNYIRKECNENVFNFGQSLIELFDIFYQSLTINSIDFSIITDNEDIYTFESRNKYGNRIMFINEEISNDILFGNIISILPKGGYIMIYLKHRDLKFLLMLEDYMNSSYFKYSYYYYLINPEYFIRKESDTINRLSNIVTFSFLSENTTEFTSLFESFYGNKSNRFTSSYEIYMSNAVVVFLEMSESVQYNTSNLIEYRKSIFEKKFILPSGKLKISADYSFVYPVSQVKFKQNKLLYGETVYIDSEVTISDNIRCDFRNSTKIEKETINIYLLSNEEENYFELSSILNSYLEESNSNTNFKFSLKLLPFYDINRFNISLKKQPSNSIYIGSAPIQYKEEMSEILKEKESVLFNVGYSEPNGCYSNIISMNSYLTTYILPIMLYIKNKCSNLVILYNRKSIISLRSAEFFKNEVEYMQISSLLFINIINIESLKQFLFINQKLIFEPNCIINFLDNNFTSTLINVSERIVSYPVSLYSLNVNEYNFPYSSLIHHYIITNYNPFDKSSELINEMKIRRISKSIETYPKIVYSYMTIKYISDYILNLKSSKFVMNELLKNINNLKILHPSNLKVRINDGNYLNQPLFILYHNNIGFDFVESFSINEEIETSPYSLRRRLVCSFNSDDYSDDDDSEIIEPIRFGYIYSLNRNEIMSLSYMILLNQILSLSHLSLSYNFVKRVGLEYYLYNINDDDNNCKDGLLYMSNQKVEYLFSSIDNLCFSTTSEIISNSPNIIYFYSGYTYHNQCVKQIFYTELLPSQIFPSLLSFVDYHKLDKSYVLYDNESISSIEYKVILENLIYEYKFGINEYIDINDVENYKRIIDEYKNSTYIYVGSFESFSKVVDDFRLICGDDDKYYLYFVSTNQYYLTESFLNDENLYFLSSPVYGEEYFNDFLYKYSINKNEHLFNLETSYLSHEIIFDLLNETKLNEIHNRSVFYDDIYTKKINANGIEISFNGNNNINRPLIINNKNEIVKEYVYFIESRINSSLICKFDDDLKLVNLLILINENANKLYLYEFINIVISNINGMKEHIYFNQSYELFNEITCDERIDNYFESDGYDILIYISPKILYCKDKIINNNNVDKPIFIISNNATEICKENIYLTGMLVEQYLSPILTFFINDAIKANFIGVYKPFYILFWLSEEYVNYYKNLIEEMKEMFGSVYTQFNDDIDELYEFLKTLSDYLICVFVEQREDLLLYFRDDFYPHMTMFRLNIFVNIIADMKYGGTIVTTYKYNIEDDEITSKTFYRIMDDAKGSNNVYYSKDFNNYIPSLYSTILFLKEVMIVSSSVKYNEYKGNLYEVEINSIEGKVRLGNNNLFEKDYYRKTAPENKKLFLYRNDLLYYKNENYECNIKENNGLVKLSPLYVGLFFLYWNKISFVSINTILDRMYMLRKEINILKNYYIHPIYGSYSYNCSYTETFLSFLNSRKEELSVIFLTIPNDVDIKVVEKICDDKRIIMFNVDYSININSKYFINAGLSINVYSHFLFKNSIKNSTFVYVLGDNDSFKSYRLLLDLYENANINYTLIDNDYINSTNIDCIGELVGKCNEYSKGHYCSFVVLVSYRKASLIPSYFYERPWYKENMTFFMGEMDHWDPDYRYLDGWNYITSYFHTFDENNLDFLGSDATEYNNYILSTPSGSRIDFSYSYQEIVYSTTDIYMQLLNKSISIKPNDIINDLYYSEYHSASGRLYISDTNSVERRLFTGVFNYSTDSFDIKSYTSILSASLFDDSYYKNNTYIGVLLDYDEDHELLSRMLLLSINELIYDENTKGKEFKSKLFILYHDENDESTINELMDDDKINFIMGCVSSYCNNLVIESMKNRNNKLFFSSIESEDSLCEKHVISSSLSLDYKVNLTLSYLKRMEISRLLFLYEGLYQLYFIKEIINNMNEVESMIIDINNNTYNDSNYIDSLLNNNHKVIILNLLKESRLKSFLQAYVNSNYTMNVFNHIIYYYDYYYIGKELKEKIDNFIILSSYSGDNRDMSVYLFEQYLKGRLGSEFVISPELASADCLFKLLVSSYSEAMKVMLNKKIDLTGENIVEYTQIFSQSISLNCGLGRIRGTISNTLSHQLYFNEKSQTNGFVKIYPDWSIMINPFDDINKECYNGPEIINYEYSETTLIVVLSIFIFFTLFYLMLLILIIRNKRKRIIKRSSLVILVYEIISNYLIIIISVVKNFNMNNNWLCKIYDIFGIALIINSILAIVLKSWRIHLIYNNSKMTRVRFSSESIILMCLSLTFVWIVYSLISGLIYDFGKMEVSYSSEYSNEIKDVFVRTCSYNQIYNFIEIFIIYIIAGIGIYFSWSTRKVGDSYSESHAFTTSIFFICIFILAYFSIYTMILYKPDTRLLFDVISFGCAGLFCTCLMVIPKIYNIYFNTEKFSKNLCCFSVKKVFPDSDTTTTSSPASSSKEESDIEKNENKKPSVDEENVNKESPMTASNIKINTFCENGNNNIKITIRNNNVNYLNKNQLGNNPNIFVSCKLSEINKFNTEN